MNESDETGGMNTLDLLGASEATKQIVRIMLRRREIGYEEILESLGLPQGEVDAGLDEMVERGWIERRTSDDGTIYYLAIQKKEGSDVTRARRSESIEDSKMAELWGKLEDGAEEANEGRDAQDAMEDFHRTQKMKKPPKKSPLDILADDDMDEARIRADSVREVKGPEQRVEPLDLSGTEVEVEADEPAEDKPGGFFQRLFGWLRK